MNITQLLNQLERLRYTEEEAENIYNYIITNEIYEKAKKRTEIIIKIIDTLCKQNKNLCPSIELQNDIKRAIKYMEQYNIADTDTKIRTIQMFKIVRIEEDRYYSYMIEPLPGILTSIEDYKYIHQIIKYVDDVIWRIEWGIWRKYYIEKVNIARELLDNIDNKIYETLKEVKHDIDRNLYKL